MIIIFCSFDTTMQGICLSWALLSRKVVTHHFTFGFSPLIVAHLDLFIETNKYAYMWGRDTLSVSIGVYISCMGLFLHVA